MNKKEEDNLQTLRHTAAHLLAAAALDLWPGTHNAIGPSIDGGFYQDFDFGEGQISEGDLLRIEERMREMVAGWGEFVEREVSIEEARELFADNPYKLELAEEFAQGGKSLTVNDPGSFLDLCRGGHVNDASESLKHFKLLSVAGAYWRGDEKNKMLTRIYGTAFTSAGELDKHLQMLEEAKKRDHRKLGKQLDLFTFSPLVGPGLPMFTPRGTVIREELEGFLQSIQEPLRYQRVTIPHITKPELYKTSGHWDKFEDDLFHVQGKGDEPFVMKPMNCPHHTQIYASRLRSYRDLPLRYSEVTMVYRDEQAGELQGLSRVRSISQDDAHVFCTPEQIGAEVELMMRCVHEFYAPFGFELDVRLSVRDPGSPDKYLGDDEVWNVAESSLTEALKDNDIGFERDEGEAAFYGPKIDFVARDSLNRSWQLATIQVDLNMPERFELKYTDAKGAAQQPVMLHRAIMGAVERFMAILLEHYAGALPLWLSPTQVAVLPISDDQIEYAEDVANELRGAGVRVEVDTRAESIGKKIREAETMKVPAMLVVGQQEVEARQVSLRLRGSDQGAKPVADVLAELTEAIQDRADVLG